MQLNDLINGDLVHINRCQRDTAIYVEYSSLTPNNVLKNINFQRYYIMHTKEAVLC